MSGGQAERSGPVASSAPGRTTGQDDQVFSLPDLGEGLTEAEITTWRVAEGDEVAVDDIVAEVETAKAAVEVPCPYAGVVTKLHGSPGDTIRVGEPLVSVAARDDPTLRAADVQRDEERAGSGAVLVGYGTTSGGRRRRRGSTRPAPQTAPPAAAAKVISPVVRRLARAAGIDVSTLTGSGPAGVVLRRDLDARLASTGRAAEPTHEEAGEPVGAGANGESRTPLLGMRRATAEKLVRSRTEIPDVTTWVDVDATHLLEAREAMRRTHPDVGLMALLARFAVAGLARFPELNVSVEGQAIVHHDRVNLGFAAQTERGLVVPVVKDAHARTTASIGAEISRLTASARNGSLAPADLTGGTFTLNNYGVFGVDGSTPIINHPEAALLGVGRVVDKPWAVDGELTVRKVTQLSLTFDHRVCDGGTAGGYLRYVADCVESPYSLLAEV